MKLIDADKLLKAIRSDDWKRVDNLARESYISLIEKQPIVDAEPVVHAHWDMIENPIDPDEPADFYCTNCHSCSSIPTHYCPNCNAKMDEEEGNTDEN